MFPLFLPASFQYSVDRLFVEMLLNPLQKSKLKDSHILQFRGCLKINELWLYCCIYLRDIYEIKSSYFLKISFSFKPLDHYY